MEERLYEIPSKEITEPAPVKIEANPVKPEVTIKKEEVNL